MVPGIIFACRQITWSHHFFSVLSGFNGTIFAYGQVSRTVPILLTCLIWCIFFYPFFINIFKKYCCKHIANERRAFNTKENLKKLGKLKKWEEIWEVFKSCTLPLVVVWENARTILYFVVAVFLQMWRKKVITCYHGHCSAAKNLSLILVIQTLCWYKKKISFFYLAN